VCVCVWQQYGPCSWQLTPQLASWQGVAFHTLLLCWASVFLTLVQAGCNRAACDKHSIALMVLALLTRAPCMPVAWNKDGVEPQSMLTCCPASWYKCRSFLLR
jgi:hypothetical protein